MTSTVPLRTPLGSSAPRTNGRRIVIFSGGGKISDEALLDQTRAIRDGGGFGSIIGRNTFQRPREEALKLLRTIMDIYKGAEVATP